MKRISLVGLMCAALLCSSCMLGKGQPGQVRGISEDLPISRVVLYQNGVGYFERQGKLDGNVLRLHCRPNQINDLLKSLTVIDRGSGRPVSISLPLEKTGARILSELPRQVRGASGLLDVLRVFRGARVTVYGRRGKAEGRVIGVEQGLLQVARGRPITGWRLTLKSGPGDLVVYPVNQITRLVLKDRALEVGLDRSLDVSLDEGTWKPVTLAVRLAGDTPHDLMVSYIVEMPNWKPAYRLVMHPDRPPLLQGWAVVDNMSGESWKEVGLSLVAGTPMSFVYDLHSPRFTRRVDLTPRGVRTALAPTRERAGYGIKKPRAEPSRTEDSAKDRLQRVFSSSRRAPGRSRARYDKQGGKGMRHRGDEGKMGRRGPRGHDAPADLKSGAFNLLLEKQIQTNVKAEKLGSLFSYVLKDPVTVPAASSTLVNIVNARMPGGQVVLFRPELTSGYRASHPYRAVKFSNKSEMTLEKGPVTIYSKGTFVGEGFLERMEKGTTIFLTYSIDGNVSMTHRRKWDREVVKLLKIWNGQIYSEEMSVDRRTFSVTNRHDKPVTAYVKVASRGGYKLRKPPAGTVTTAAASYLPLTVAAGKTGKLAVELVSPTKRWYGVDTSMATTVLKLYFGSGKVPATIRPTLEKILKAKKRLGEINAETSRIRRLKRELTGDVTRIRDNLNILRKVKGNAALRGRMSRNLSKLEAKLSKLTASYVALDEERARLRGTMRALIGEIRVDNSK